MKNYLALNILYMAIRSCHGKKNTQPTFCNQHRNSKGNVRTKVGFVFIIKFKKKKLLRNLNKRREYFSVREQTPRYKIITVWTPDLSHLLQSRDGEEIAETNK